MEVRILSGKEGRHGSLIPEGYVRETDRVLVLKEKERETGAALLMQKGEAWVLTWLFVLPEERGRGYGSVLLDAAISETEKRQGQSLEIYINEKAPDRDRFLAMLSARNFFLTWESIPKVIVTREQLKKAVFFTDPVFHKSIRDSRTEIHSLRQVTRQQRKNFRNLCEKKKNFLVSRADFERADPDQSKVLTAGDEIVGIALIRTLEKEKILTLCYVEKKYTMELLSLFRRMSEELLQSGEKMERLSFCCISENVRKLAEHILPERELVTEKVIVGERMFYKEV